MTGHQTGDGAALPICRDGRVRPAAAPSSEWLGHRDLCSSQWSPECDCPGGPELLAEQEASSSLQEVSLFSGIGGISRGLELAGARTVLLCEQDKHARKILAHHFPDAAIHNDVTELTADDCRAAGAVPGRTVLTAGFPCQPFSNAGKRRGVRDPRGTLFFEVLRLIRDFRPQWVLLENVPGLLSIDDGETLRSIMTLLTEERYLVDIDILDARFFGVPQRRRRVIIQCQAAEFGLGATTITSALTTAQLLIESLAGYLAAHLERSPVEETSSVSLGSSADGLRMRMRLLSAELSPDELLTWHLSLLAANPKSASERGHSAPRIDDQAEASPVAGMSSPAGGAQGAEVHHSSPTGSSWRSIWADLCEMAKSSTTSTPSRPTTTSTIFTCAQMLLSISERIALWTDWSPNSSHMASSISTVLKAFIDYARQTSSSLFGDMERADDWDAFIRKAGGVIDALGHLGDTGAAPAQVLLEPEGLLGDPAQGITPRPSAARVARAGPAAGGWATRQHAATLTAGGHAAGVSAPGRRHEDDHNLVVGVLGDHAHTLTAEGHDASEDGTGRGTPVIAFQHTAGIDMQPSASVAPTLKAGHDATPSVVYVADAITALDTAQGGPDDNTAQGGQLVAYAGEGTVVRRLTPLELERLQGFPDGWTDNGQADTQRSKQLGNSVAVPVFEWVGRRLVAVDNQLTLTHGGTHA